ncbi:MAG: hypothetical protein ACE5JB_15840 [bacterium]
MKKLCLSILVLATLFAANIQGEEASVIKVTGPYGIINKGTNQGVTEGQIYYVKRESASEIMKDVKVKVIRTTANRAAVEQISKSSKSLLQLGDKLFSDNIIKQASFQNNKAVNNNKSLSTKSYNIEPRNNKKTKINNFKMKNEVPLPEAKDYYLKQYNLKEPWISLNVGALVPVGDLEVVYSPSFRIGANYMVTAGRNLNLGLEINNTFFNGSSLSDSNPFGAENISASLLEALLVFQSFLGNNLFIEVGSGIYRPKLRTTSPDAIEFTYSSTNFGIFGGTGIFVPTSKYAGFSIKGRYHNYFNHGSRQYYGITGGFRFKLYGFN